MNTTGRATFKRWIVQSAADVILVQETGVDALDAGDMINWCAKRGWRMVCAPAARAVKTIGGVAIVVKAPEIALERRISTVLVNHRLVAATIRVQGWSPILVGAV